MRALLLLLLFALPLNAATGIDSWVAGEYIYARVTVEKNSEMPGIVHKQKASVTISGPSGSQTFTTDFVLDKAEATVVVPYKDGTYNISGSATIFCTQGNRVFSYVPYNFSDRYGTAGICVQKSISTCTVGPTGIVSCWYYPICSWPNCSADFSIYIYGANNQRYLVKKKFRERSGTVTCFPQVNIVADSCIVCTQTYD